MKFATSCLLITVSLVEVTTSVFVKRLDLIKITEPVSSPPPLVNETKPINCPPERPKFETPVGVFCGRREVVHWPDGEASKVDIFYGIRYAAPPLGSLRFQKPDPTPALPKVIFFADQRPPACPQLNDTMYPGSVLVRMWQVNGLMSEDCLYLNIFVPTPNKNRDTTEKLAVMVWIYGGSFNTGSGVLSVYDGRFLAARQNVIVVTLNYRIGALGFLYMDIKEIPGNMGLWDQRMAMKWVKDNIENFGGDSERITLFGESSGSVSISAHIVSPWSHTFFKNAIMQSGSLFGNWAAESRTTLLNRSRKFAELLGCHHASKEYQVNCLRNKPVSQLLDAHNELFSANSYFSIPFPVVLDNHFLPYENLQQIKQFRFLKSGGSLMYGVNKNEGSYFLLYAFVNNSLWKETETQLPIGNEKEYLSFLQMVLDLGYEGLPSSLNRLMRYANFEYEDYNKMPSLETWTERLEDISSDRSFKCPTIEMASAITSAKRFTKATERIPVYFYEFQHQTSSMPVPKWMGAMHGYEIEYVFGIPFSPTFQADFYRFTDDERQLSDLVMTYWANFARTSDPNILPGEKHVIDLNVASNAVEKNVQLPEFNGSDDINEKQAVLEYLNKWNLPVSLRKCKFIGWPEFSHTIQSYMVVANAPNNLKVESSPRERQCTFWSRWYPVLLEQAQRCGSTS